MKRPRISLLIATADRSCLLKECLQALEASTFTDAEVLILDQSREMAELPMTTRDAGDLVIRHIRCPRRGKSAALNVGIREARGTLLAFTDDDCRVAPDWLEVIDRLSREEGDRSVLTGKVLADAPDVGAVMAPSLRVDGEGRTYRAPVFRDVLFGNNMAIPIGIFGRVGSFDESLGPGTESPAAEDNDLGYRLLRFGVPIRYLPQMVVVHRSWRSESDQVTLFRAYGIGQGAFYGKHVRRGDLHMLVRALLNLWHAGRDLSGAAVLRRRYDLRASKAFAAGLVRGFVRAAESKGGESIRRAQGR